jgi:hypothetical protein
MPETPASLDALLRRSIDYAGLYPPAELPLPSAVENYERYRLSRDSWILNRLVLPAAKLPDARRRPDWHITLLVEDEPGALPPEVEALETKLARRLSLPTYCEAQPASIDGAFAKLRTGGVTPEAIPDAASISEFLLAAAARRMAIKATAGLHHAIRSVRPLTYAPNAPRAAMHGFINVLAAAAFIWSGADREAAIGILNEEDAGAFAFLPDRMEWRGHELSTAAIATARAEFAHSFGSCSFEEPVADLRELGWLP